jgi:hypothetical protein
MMGDGGGGFVEPAVFPCCLAQPYVSNALDDSPTLSLPSPEQKSENAGKTVQANEKSPTVRRLPILMWEGEREKKVIPKTPDARARAEKDAGLDQTRQTQSSQNPQIASQLDRIPLPNRPRKKRRKSLCGGCPCARFQPRNTPQAVRAWLPLHIQIGGASQMVLGVRALVASMTSSRWLHMATNRSKKSFPLPSPYTSLPHFSISACMVPLRLNVLRQRMMRAR